MPYQAVSEEVMTPYKIKAASYEGSGQILLIEEFF